MRQLNKLWKRPADKHYHYYKNERKHVFHPLKLLAFCNFYER